MSFNPSYRKKPKSKNNQSMEALKSYLSIKEILRHYEVPVKIRARQWTLEGCSYELRGLAPIGLQESVGWMENGGVVGFDNSMAIWEVLPGAKMKLRTSE